MSKLSERLKTLRKEANLSQAELAGFTKISKSSINMYERGEREPGTDRMEIFADFFNVDMDYLYGRTDIKNAYKYLKSLGKSSSNMNLIEPNITEDYVTFPVIGEIAAGFDSFAVEDWSGETVDIPTHYLRGRSKSEFFVLTVKGDSMYPLYHEGDKVLILKQPTLNRSGDIGAIIYDGEYATLKKIEYVQGEDWLKLVPLNPSYRPETIEGADLERCKVIGIPKLLIREIEE